MKLGMCMYQCFSRAKQCGWTNQNRSGSGVSQQTSCKHYHSRLVLAVRQGYQTNYKKTSLSSRSKWINKLYRPLDFGSAILPKIGDANKRFMTFYDHNSKNMLLTFVNTIDVWGNMTTSIQITPNIIYIIQYNSTQTWSINIATFSAINTIYSYIYIYNIHIVYIYIHVFPSHSCFWLYPSHPSTKLPEGALTRHDGSRKAHHIGRNVMHTWHPESLWVSPQLSPGDSADCTAFFYPRK